MVYIKDNKMIYLDKNKNKFYLITLNAVLYGINLSLVFFL